MRLGRRRGCRVLLVGLRRRRRIRSSSGGGGMEGTCLFVLAGGVFSGRDVSS